MQNLVRGCGHEALSSAVDPIIDIITNKKIVVDHGSDDSIIDTSQNDMLLGGRFYPISTEGVVASGNCQTIRHDQNEQKSCCYMLSDDFMCTLLGSPQHTANQGRGWAPTNGAPDVTYGILDCSGTITNVLVGTHVGPNDLTARACKAFEGRMEKMAYMINEEALGNGHNTVTIETFSGWRALNMHAHQQHQGSVPWHAEMRWSACEFKHCTRHKSAPCNSTMSTENMILKYWIILMVSITLAVKYVMTTMVSPTYAVNEGRWTLMEIVSPASIIHVIGGSSHAVPRSIVSTGSYRSRMLQNGIWLVIVIAAFVHTTGKSESQRLFVGSSIRDDIRLWVVSGVMMLSVYASTVPLRNQAGRVSISGKDRIKTVPVAQLIVSCIYQYYLNICIISWLWSVRLYKCNEMIWAINVASVVIIILRVLLVESSNDDPFYEGSETILNKKRVANTGKDGLSQKSFNIITYTYACLLGYICLTCHHGSHQLLFILSRPLVVPILKCCITWASVWTQSLRETKVIGACNEEESFLGITISHRDFIFPGVRSTYLKMGLGDIGDSGEHMAICGDMVNHGFGHTFNVCTIHWIIGSNVCSQCSDSVSCDITASQVLAMDHHSWPSSVSLGHERPPPEPPPGVRPPPEPPPVRHGIRAPVVYGLGMSS